MYRLICFCDVHSVRIQSRNIWTAGQKDKQELFAMNFFALVVRAFQINSSLRSTAAAFFRYSRPIIIFKYIQVPLDRISLIWDRNHVTKAEKPVFICCYRLWFLLCWALCRTNSVKMRPVSFDFRHSANQSGFDDLMDSSNAPCGWCRSSVSVSPPCHDIGCSFQSAGTYSIPVLMWIDTNPTKLLWALCVFQLKTLLPLSEPNRAFVYELWRVWQYLSTYEDGSVFQNQVSTTAYASF